jgi:NCS2 family nucleobase:cation symporter-2
MLMQSAMIIGGLTTLIQLFPVFGFGVGLPTVMGVAFAYMPILTTIGMQYGISAIFGVQLVAAFASIFIGMFIGKIRKFFPPIVCGTVVLAIGLSLYNTAINYFGGGSAAQAAGTFGSPQFWILALVTLAVTLVCSLFGKGYVKVSGMIIGVGVGYVVALIMGGIIDFAPPWQTPRSSRSHPAALRPRVPPRRDHHDDPHVHRPGGSDHRRRVLHYYGRLRP